ncbi:hypothetical protein N431DRAFT_433228 [Stipitochalara longipes BDJ]|nr:hypothetical protein N431DRAFT_433228 [Stipitochalara longipes BDJ]
MPTISSLKTSVFSALRKPHEASKPRLKRRVIPFREAFNNLKTSKNGVVTCVAFHSFGKCRKEIALLDLDFLANLDQLNMADVQTPIKLMPLMLCAHHWEKTVYHNALFLDWLSTYGSKQDNQHYESIVVDYQSAVAIDDEPASALSTPPPSKPLEEDPIGVASSQNSFTNESSHTSKTLQAQSDHDKPHPSDPEEHVPRGEIPAISVLMSMDAFASIEFGVVKLEIMYRDNLKCIAMTTDGWRCEEVIDQEQLLRARGHLSASSHCETETDIAPLPPMVLCPGHAQGDLPRIYTERWATFAEQRLPKEEAMRKFDAEFWMSVQFFPNKSREEHGFLFPPAERPVDQQRRSFDSSGPQVKFSASEWAATFAPPVKKYFAKPIPFESKDITKTRSMENLGENAANAANAATLAARRMLPLPERKRVLKARSTSTELDAPGTTPDLRHSWGSTLFPNNAESLTNSKPSDVTLQPELNISLGSKAASEASIPLENQTNSQTPDQEIPTSRFFPKEISQHSDQTRPQSAVDDKLLAEMSAPISQGGSVYVHVSKDLKLVKVSQGYVKGSRPHILGQCKLASSDTSLINHFSTMYPDRVEKLVQLELERFHAEVTCQHHLDGTESDAVEDEHGKWFDVPENVVLASVGRWVGFVERAYTVEGNVEGKWAKSISLLLKPTEAETRALEVSLLASSWGVKGGISWLHYHSIRNERYADWYRNALLSDLGLNDESEVEV